MWCNVVCVVLLVLTQFLHNGEAHILGMNGNEIKEVQSVIGTLLKSKNYYAGFYDKMKDYVQEDLKAEVGKKGPSLEKEMLDKILNPVDFLNDDKKLKESLKPATLNKFFKLKATEGKKETFRETFVTFLRTQLGPALKGAAESAINAFVDKVVEYATSCLKSKCAD